MIDVSEIRDFADRIVQAFRPERIILFGSYARGKATADSDVDLLVLTEHEGKDWEYAAKIRNQVSLGYPLDLLVRTPACFEERLAMGDPFVREIAEDGVVLYEAAHR